MNGGKVIGNYADLFGGGISLSGSFTFNNGIIEENETAVSSKYNDATSNLFYDNADVIIGQSSSFLMNGGELNGNLSTVAGSSKSPTFTLTDGIVKGNFRILNGLTATISGGTLNGSIYISKGACIVSDTALIYGGRNENGGSVYLEGGNFEMKGGIIRESAADNGGAVYVSNGNFTMSGGSILDCEATYDGGAVYVYGGTVNITGGEIGKIENNKKIGCMAERGGGIFINSGTLKMSGGAIVGNTAKESGGGIQISDGNVYISGGKISSNVARGETTTRTSDVGYGGGIFVDGGDTVSITGGEISSNVAAKNGGGIEVKTSNTVTIDIYSGTFLTNVADECGGAIGVECDNGTINMGEENCDGSDMSEHIHPVISNNLAGIQGGGFYMNSSGAVLNIYCASVDNNTVNNIENNFEQLSGTITIYEGVKVGTSNEGMLIVGGTFDDKRCESEELLILTYYSNFEDSLDSRTATITKGSLVTLPGDIFGNEGYIVKGWTTDKTNETLIEYEAGEVLELSNSITLYALWIPEEENEPSFLVVIPAQISYDNSDETMTFDIDVTLNLFPRNKALNIEMKDEDFKFKMYQDASVIDSVQYEMKLDGKEINSDEIFLSVYSDSALITYNVTERVEVTLEEKPAYAGVYEDTVTFLISTE